MSVFAKEQKGLVRRIIELTEKLAQIPEGFLRGPNRSREYIAPRHLAMLACREIAGTSFPQIAKAFGGRHHTSIMYAIGAAKGRADWQSDLELIRRELEATR